jgi:hypothetical protein
MAPVSDGWLEIEVFSAVRLPSVAAAKDALRILFLDQMNADLGGNGAAAPADNGEFPSLEFRRSCVAVS